jgi:hypothetical protein
MGHLPECRHGHGSAYRHFVDGDAPGAGRAGGRLSGAQRRRRRLRVGRRRGCREARAGGRGLRPGGARRRRPRQARSPRAACSPTARSAWCARAWRSRCAKAHRGRTSTEEALRRAVLAARSLGHSTGPSGTALLKLFERWGILDEVRAAHRAGAARRAGGATGRRRPGRTRLPAGQRNARTAPGIRVLGPCRPAARSSAFSRPASAPPRPSPRPCAPCILHAFAGRRGGQAPPRHGTGLGENHDHRHPRPLHHRAQGAGRRGATARSPASRIRR